MKTRSFIVELSFHDHVDSTKADEQTTPINTWDKKLGYDKPCKYAYVRIKEMYDGFEFTSSAVMQVFHDQTMEAKADLYVSDFRDSPDDDDPVREKNEEGWYEQNNGSLVKVEYVTEISKEEYDIMNKYL